MRCKISQILPFAIQKRLPLTLFYTAFAENLEAKLDISGNYGFASGASVAGSVKSELKLDKTASEVHGAMNF